MERKPDHLLPNDMSSRPISDHTTSFQNPPPRIRPLQDMSNEPWPPPVVRRVQTGPGLQDLLLPSIESAPAYSLASASRLPTQQDTYRGLDNQQSYVRRDAERRRETPDQVIVIDDNSPQMQRFRPAREAESSRFGPPLSYQTTHRAASHLSDPYAVGSSSIQPTARFVPRAELQPRSDQGLLMSTRAPAPRAPIYAERQGSNYSTNLANGHIGHLRQPESSTSSDRQYEPRTIGVHDSLPAPRPRFDDHISMRRPLGPNEQVIDPAWSTQRPGAEYDPRDRIQRPASTTLPIFHKPTRSYEGKHGLMGAGQPITRNSTDFRAGPSMSRTSDGFIIHEEHRQSLVARGDETLRYGGTPSLGTPRSFQPPPTLAHHQEVRYREGELPRRVEYESYQLGPSEGGSHGPHYGGRGQAILQSRADPASTRRVHPRPEVIVIE